VNSKTKHPITCLIASSIGAAIAVLLAVQAATSLYASEASQATEETLRTSKSSASAPKLDLSSYLPRWARAEFLGIAIWQFVVAFVFILLGLVLKKVSDYVFEKKFAPFLARTRLAFDNLLTRAASKPLGYLFFLGGIYGALAVLVPTGSNIRDFAFGAIKVLVATDVLWFLFRMIDVLVEYLTKLTQRTESKLDDQLIPLLRKALKVTVGVVCFLWVVQLLGLKVSSLLAGLGIGGLAVALALQDTLANFFGSVFIFLDRPFAVGDWIKVNDVEGTVEDIGFRSTRVRTWPKSLVSIPNKTVAAATIDNWSKMPKRRVMQTVGVTYETTPEQMEQAVAAIRGIVENNEGVDKEFIVIRFTEFGDSSLNILVYYFTRATAFANHLATKERINLAIMRALRKLGLSIAFPTRTLYFEGQVARGLAARLGSEGEKSPPEGKDGRVSPSGDRKSEEGGTA
jgi:MscS family membrane protein